MPELLDATEITEATPEQAPQPPVAGQRYTVDPSELFEDQPKPRFVVDASKLTEQPPAKRYTIDPAALSQAPPPPGSNKTGLPGLPGPALPEALRSPVVPPKPVGPGPQPDASGVLQPPTTMKAPLPQGIMGDVKDSGKTRYWHGEIIGGGNTGIPSDIGTREEFNAAMGFGPGGYGGSVPKLSEDAPTHQKIANGIQRGLADILSPKAAIETMAFLMAGEAAPALANMPQIANALRGLPTVVKALDVTSRVAIPAAIAVEQGKGLYEGGVPKDIEAATETAIRALLLGASVAGAIHEGRATLQSYPPALVEPTGPTYEGAPNAPAPGSQEAAPATAEALTQQGRRLAATAWQNLAEWGAKGDQPFSIKAGDKTLTVEPQEKVKGQRPGFVVKDETGKVVTGGTASMVKSWLDQNIARQVSSSEAGGGLSVGSGAVEPSELRQVTTTTSAPESAITRSTPGDGIEQGAFFETPLGDKFTVLQNEGGMVTYQGDRSGVTVKGTRPIGVFRKMVGAAAPQTVEPEPTSATATPAPAAVEQPNVVAPAPESTVPPSAAAPEAQTGEKIYASSASGEKVPYSDILDFLRKQGKGSTSSLQRQFKFEHGVAKKALDDATADGVLGPENGSRPRELLKTADDTQPDGQRRVTGSTPIDLSPEGRQQGQEMAAAQPQPFTRVIAGPSARTQEMAKYFTQPGIEVETSDSFDASHRGELEGKPADDVKDQIADLLENPKTVAPGVSPTSGKPGESQEQFEHNLFSGVQKLEASVKPEDRALVVTHGGDLQAIDAWAKAGKPTDYKFDRKDMAKEPYWSATGQLFKLTDKGLVKVADNSEPGIYFTEHAATAYNPPKEQTTQAPASPSKEVIPASAPVTPEQSGAEASLSTPEIGKRDTSIAQGAGNGLASNPDLGGDLAQAKSVSEHGLSLFDIPAQRAMMARVIAAIHDPQIRDSIVDLIPVNVMNDLAIVKPSAQVDLHDGSVFQNPVLSSEKDSSVSILRDVADSVVRRLAGLAAKDIASGKHGGISSYLFPASKAGKRDLSGYGSSIIASPATKTSNPGVAGNNGAIEGRSANGANKSHDHSSTQFNMPEPIAKATQKFAESIPKDLLVDKGVENEPHVTLLYGLHDNISANVEKVLQGENPVTVKLGRTSVFKTPDADVLKLDVESPELHALNAKMSALPNSNEHPVYVPHVTIAYLKSGTSDPYVGKVVVGATGMKPTLDTVKFSPAEGEAKHIALAPVEKLAEKTPEQKIADNEQRIAELQAQLAATPAPNPPGTPTPADQLANAVYEKLKSGQSLGNVTEFNKMAEQYFGSSRASGQWTPKDAFDAMEAGVNKHLIDRGADLLSMPYAEAMTELRGLMERVTSQGVRTEEQIQNQQFSTPPTEAFTAAKVAGIKPTDTVLEPSAGNGGLAVWPKSIEARVYVNEISDRRRAMLENVGFPNPTDHDGEIINALLDPGIKPTVILMNPPFSAGTVKTGKAANDNKYGFNHVDSALQRLTPGGRLVAILGGGRANDPNGGATLFGGPSGRWFTELAKRYNIRGNVRIHGKEYQKYGTAFATRLIVIDKNGPTPSRVASTPSWDSVVKGAADTLEQAYDLLKDVAESRPANEAVARGAVSTRQSEPRTPQAGTGNVTGGDNGGVLVNRPGTSGESALGGTPQRGGSVKPNPESRPGVSGEPTGLREPGSKSQESTEAPTPGAAQGSAQNADIERPLPNQPGDVIGGAGLTREQIIAAAAKRLAEKTGRTLAPSTTLVPTITTPEAKAPEPKPQNAMSAAAEEARQRLRDKLRKQGGEEPVRYSYEYRAQPDPIDAETLIDLSSIGAEHILNGATNFEDWSKEFNQDVGDLVNEIAKSNAQAVQDINRQVYDLSREVAKQFGGEAEPAPTQVDPKLTESALTGNDTDVAPLSINENLLPKSEEEDSAAYVTYRPTLAGPAHPGSIVETKTMSTVPLPKITYQPKLPESILKEGRLSAVQLEAIAIAGQQNQIILPSGHRGSALGGDGTGVGKGREAAGILLDNWNQGRKRLVWVSVKWDLMQDAMRDLDGIGAKELLKGNEKKANGQYAHGSTSSVQPFSRYKYGDKIKHEGVLFSTYALIRSENNKGGKRVNDLEAYLRGDDDGEGAYIVFDECVPAGTQIATPRGSVSIENLKIGDSVFGFDHSTDSITETTVKHCFQRETQSPLYDINNTSLTGNHPVWTTNRGYIPSALICNLDNVLQFVAESSNDNIDVRMVQARVCSEETVEQQTETAKILFNELLRAMANERSTIDGSAYSYAGGSSAAGGIVAQNDYATRYPRKDSLSSLGGYKSVSRSANERKGPGCDAGAWIRDAKRRERPAAFCSTSNAIGSPSANVAELETGIPNIAREEETRISNKLQGGYWESNNFIGSGGRRRGAQGNSGKIKRSEKSENVVQSWVEHYEILKSGNIERPGFDSAGRVESRTVFNIETTSSNYFADGLLVHNCHYLKNAVVGGQGAQPSQIGKAIKELMQRMPKLRSVSLSATAATDVMNLGYLDRLGLWGPGTPFPTGFNEFASQIAGGRLAAMEMVARELKAQGKYVSRTLSFKGVTYSEEEHVVNDDQKALYRTATEAWKSVIQEAEQAIRTTTNGGAKQTARFLSQLGATQQRFFNLLITALKTPTAVELANKALADGKSVVITLVNTNEAAQTREKNRVAASEDENEAPDYDFGPKQLIMDLVKEHFPVQQFRDNVDDNGNPIKVPVTRIDSEGREIAVNNPEAEAARDALLEQINRDLHMPENPLDILINSLGGPSKVAELTGRKERFDSSVGKFVPRGDKEVARKDVNLIEMRNFQSGKKRLAVLSAAADTGISLHSGLDVANQQPRYHITLQAGWSADKAMQMFGRTHRTNQAHPPEYVLLVSDLGGEKRFISTIARRLGSLGALTKGQKNASSGTDLMEKVNFETEQGTQATTAFYDSLLKNVKVPGTNLTGMQILHDLRVLRGDPPTVPLADRGNVTKLLNRLLALDPDVQNPTYNYFYDIFQATVQRAIDAGTLDTGVKTLPGDKFSIGESRVISKDAQTGAETFYYPVEAKVRNHRVSPEDLDKRLRNHADKNPRIVINDKGKLGIAYDADPIVHASGGMEAASYFATPHNGKWVKVSNLRLNRSSEIEEWAKDENENAKSVLRSAQRTHAYNKDNLVRNNQRQQTISGSDLPANHWQRKQVEESKTALDEATRIAAEKEEIAKNPTVWAKEEWGRQYEDAPSHTAEQHHLIGGAVMRFWNPIREASAFGNIYTTVDSKTGQRVVGVDIPDESIGSLLQRITGGASTVNARQLILDVLRNNLNYALEGNIQIRRGRVGRENVIQIIPANGEQANNLKSLGVIYERGVVPVYYIPNAVTGPRENTQYTVLSNVLDQYPIKTDERTVESDDEDEPSRYNLSEKSAPVNAEARAEYRNGVLWVTPSMMERISRAIGGPSKIGGVYIPPKVAQDVPDMVNGSPAIKQALRDAIADRRSITVVVQHPGASIGELKTRARHELFHSTEIWAGPTRGNELLKDPLAQRAADNLARKGYDRNDTQMVWSEIGAHLASGPIGWSDMGLNRQEAKDLFRKYLTLLDPETIGKLRQVAPQLNQELYAARSINEARARIHRGLDRENRATEESAGRGDVRSNVRAGVPGESARYSRPVNDNERGAAPAITDLISGAAKLVRGSNYSTAGAIETTTTRGLGQIKRANPEVHAMTLRAGSPEARTAVIFRAAMPAIRKALEGSGVDIAELFKYYIDSRLQGIRQMWKSLAEQTQDMPTEELAKAMKGAIDDTSTAPEFQFLLQNLEGKKGIPESPLQVVGALTQSENWEELQKYLVNVFEAAHDNVDAVLEPGEFEYIHNLVQNDPKVKEADRLYDELIGQPIQENHELHDGVLTDNLGPAGRYFPLIANKEGKEGFFERLGFKSPKNIHNVMATGLSRKGYTVELPKVKESITSSFAKSGRAAVIKAARQAGLQKPLPRSGDVDTFRYQGVDYPAKKVLIGQGRTIVENGKVIHTKSQFDYMPAWYYDEMKDILEKPFGQHPGNFKHALSLINSYALQGPADLTFHTANLVGALIGNTPFISASLGGQLASSNILTKKFQVLYELAKADPTEEEATKAFTEMANAGALPSRYASVTYSKKLSSETGAKLVRWTLSPVIYGPKGIDARARYVMWKVAQAFNPEASPKELNEFVNQLGNYTPALWSTAEKAIKYFPFSPFYTAGSTMIRNGINAFFSSGPMISAGSAVVDMKPTGGGKGPWIPKTKLQWKLQHTLTVGFFGTLAMWIALHKMLTGKYPTQDDRSKFLSIPVGGGDSKLDSYRYSKLGVWLWGDGPEVGYLGLYTFNPLFMRGARAMGIPAFYENKLLGGTTGQAFEAARRETLNTFFHPVLGPIPRAITAGVFGKEAYLASLRDRSGALNPELLSAIPKKTMPGWPTIGRQTLAAALELNAFSASLGDVAGWHGEEKKDKGQSAALLNIINMSVIGTGSVGTSTNPETRAKGILQQERALERNELRKQ